MLPSTSLPLEEIHMVRCLTKISQRHFAPGRSVVISSPATYRDVQQELIAEFHRTSIWPVVVTVDGKINMPENSEFIDKDGSFIILVPHGNIKSINAEIAGLIKDRKKEFTKLWNSEAQFVVAGANEFSWLHQMIIFEYFSTFRIYNIIIVNLEHNAIHKSYSRQTNVFDVGTGKKFGVFTWFPYQSSDHCTEVNDVILLDSWVISAQGYFTKNIDLFPRKISNNFKRCPLKAFVIDNKWYFTTLYLNVTYSNGTVLPHLVGLEIKLLSIVLQQLNITFINVNIRGIVNRNDLNMYLLLKKIYIVLGSIGSYVLSNKLFSATNSYYSMSLRWYVPCYDKNARWSSIYRIFTAQLWLVLIISFVIVAISIKLVGRYSCTSEWQGYKTLKSSFTHLWAVILGVSVSTMPRTTSLRSLFLAWVFFSLAFNTVFQAHLTTFLTDSGYRTPIRYMDELLASGMGLAYPEYMNEFFDELDETESLQIKSNSVSCSSNEICFGWAKNHKNVSIYLVDKSVEES